MSRLSKQKFFKNLDEHVGNKITMLGGGYPIANVEVKRNHVGSVKAFTVSIFYLGKTKERLSNNFKDTIVHIKCNNGFDRLGYHEKLCFHLRSFETESVSSEMQKGDVVIEGSPKENKSPTFCDVKEGQFFWNEKELYLKNDEDAATRVRDGYYYDEWSDHDPVVLQKVRVVCVD